MTDPESLRQAVQSRAPLSTWLGVVLLLVLFGVIVLAVIGPAPRGDDYEQKRAKDRAEKLKTLREADAKELTTYGWIDKNKGVVRLPIERAMELTVAELRAKPPVPAYPIATPAAPCGSAGTPQIRPARSQPHNLPLLRARLLSRDLLQPQLRIRLRRSRRLLREARHRSEGKRRHENRE